MGAFVSLTDYQRQVHDRYADKQAVKPARATATHPTLWPWWLLGAAIIVACAGLGLRAGRPHRDPPPR